MFIERNLDIVFKRPAQKDMGFLKRWYSMTDCLGLATGYKDFSEVESIVQLHKESNSLVFMIYEGKSDFPLGFIYAHMNNMDGKLVFWIKTLIVEPLYQNLGYGTTAIKKFFDYTKEKHQSIIFIVTVSNKNTRGLSFWKKLGFSHYPEFEESLHGEEASRVFVLKRIIK